MNISCTETWSQYCMHNTFLWFDEHDYFLRHFLLFFFFFAWQNMSTVKFKIQIPKKQNLIKKITKKMSVTLFKVLYLFSANLIKYSKKQNYILMTLYHFLFSNSKPPNLNLNILSFFGISCRTSLTNWMSDLYHKPKIQVFKKKKTFFGLWDQNVSNVLRVTSRLS